MLPVPSSFSMPPMRCIRPGVPGIAHGRASVSGSRRYGQNSSPWLGSVGERHRDVGQRVDVGQQPRLGAVGEVAVGEQDHRRAVLRARCAPPRTRRRSSRPATARRRSAAAPRRGGRTSRAAGRPARSWSAGRSTGRRAARRRAISGSSRLIASPIASDLRSTPGPLVRGDREAARRTRRRSRRRRPRSRPRPAASSRRSS